MFLSKERIYEIFERLVFYLKIKNQFFGSFGVAKIQNSSLFTQKYDFL